MTYVEPVPWPEPYDAADPFDSPSRARFDLAVRRTVMCSRHAARANVQRWTRAGFVRGWIYKGGE